MPNGLVTYTSRRNQRLKITTCVLTHTTVDADTNMHTYTIMRNQLMHHV